MTGPSVGGEPARAAVDGSRGAVQPPRHEKQEPTWRRIGVPIMKTTAIVIAVLVVSGASVASLAAWHLSSTVASNAVDISNGEDDAPATPEAIGPFEGGFNVLAVGADNSAGQGREYGNRGSAVLNDVNILFHVAADHKSAVVISLPRDLVIPQPQCVDPETGEEFSAVSAQPLNTAFLRGGLGCVVSTIEELTGLDIPYAATFTFAGTVAMSDAVGGVPICLDAPIRDKNSGLNLPAGTSVVSGKQALAYLRTRDSIGDGSDLARISSQQAYMSSLMRVMKSSDTLGDPVKVTRLATAAAEHIHLSDSLADLRTLASMATALKDLDLSSLVFVQYPNVTYPKNPNKVVPDAELAAELMAKVQSDETFVLDAPTPAEDLGEDAGEDAEPGGDAPATDPATPDMVPPPTDAPPVIEGLRGQTADQVTCTETSDE
jgi:LCP family protein required for cell wall assembly